MKTLSRRHWVGRGLAAGLLVAGVLTACAPPKPPASSTADNWKPTASAFIKLARPVSDLDTDGVVITERDTGRVVPASLICQDGGSDVPCTAGRINGFWIFPTHAFTLGQYYRVTFATRFLDSSRRPPITGDGTFRAGPKEEDQYSTPVYSWRTGLSRSALGGSFTTESRALAHAALFFTGGAVTVWTMTGSSHGLMDVYVDQVLRRTVDGYSRTTRYRVPVTLTGFTSGFHRLDIVVRGAKGTGASSGTDVVLDAVTTAAGTSSTPAFEYGWGNDYSTTFSQAWTSSSSNAGAVASIQFRGTAIEVGMVRGPWSGIYRAYMDGKSIGEFSEGSASFGVYNRRFTARTDGVHRFDLLVLDKHTKWAVASVVAVDYWQIPTGLTSSALHVIPPPPDTWSRVQYLPDTVPAPPAASAPPAARTPVERSADTSGVTP